MSPPARPFQADCFSMFESQLESVLTRFDPVALPMIRYTLLNISTVIQPIKNTRVKSGRRPLQSKRCIFRRSYEQHKNITRTIFEKHQHITRAGYTM